MRISNTKGGNGNGDFPGNYGSGKREGEKG